MTENLIPSARYGGERSFPQSRLEATRERCMDALDAWYEVARTLLRGQQLDVDADLIDAYAALKRAQNGEPEDE